MQLLTKTRLFYNENNGIQVPPKDTRCQIDLSEVVGFYELPIDEQYEVETVRLILKNGQEIRVLTSFDDFSRIQLEYKSTIKNEWIFKLN